MKLETVISVKLTIYEKQVKVYDDKFEAIFKI